MLELNNFLPQVGVVTNLPTHRQDYLVGDNTYERQGDNTNKRQSIKFR